MATIEIILAFALLMVLFSTIASGFTEVLLRFYPARSANLEKALRRFSEDVLWPSYEETLGLEVGLLETTHDDVIEELVDELMRNEVQPKADYSMIDKFLWWLSRYRIDELSTEGFIERLANTRVGMAFSDEPAEKREARITYLSLTFERYMAVSSEHFRKHANALAFVISIFLAVGGNISVSKLVQHLRDNPEVVAEVIEQQEEILAEIKEIPDALDGAEKLEDAINDYKELSKAFKSAQTDFKLPIGWEFYPYGDLMRPEPEANATFLIWIIEVLIAGVLIGLGAPFWYRIVKNISQIRRLAGSVGGRSPESVGDVASPKHDNEAIARAAGHVALFDASAQSNQPTLVDDMPAPLG
ncbi:MAG: hypothetical protein ABJH45_18850 [Paracoccaceae bacterium]